MCLNSECDCWNVFGGGGGYIAVSSLLLLNSVCQWRVCASRVSVTGGRCVFIA